MLPPGRIRTAGSLATTQPYPAFWSQPADLMEPVRHHKISTGLPLSLAALDGNKVSLVYLYLHASRCVAEQYGETINHPSQTSVQGRRKNWCPSANSVTNKKIPIWPLSNQLILDCAKGQRMGSWLELNWALWRVKKSLATPSSAPPFQATYCPVRAAIFVCTR